MKKTELEKQLWIIEIYLFIYLFIKAFTNQKYVNNNNNNNNNKKKKRWRGTHNRVGLQLKCALEDTLQVRLYADVVKYNWTLDKFSSRCHASDPYSCLRRVKYLYDASAFLVRIIKPALSTLHIPSEREKQPVIARVGRIT